MKSVNPVILIKDNFFPDPGLVRELIVRSEFQDIVNPEDGISYPGIAKDINILIQQGLIDAIQRLIGRRINPRRIFARMMKEEHGSPHQIHSDKLMGTFSAHVYLSEHWPVMAGTSFWTHPILGPLHEDEEIEKLPASGWENYLAVFAKFNRLLIHDASAWHCAEPSEGWGDTPENSRLVLTCFFDTF